MNRLLRWLHGLWRELEPRDEQIARESLNRLRHPPRGTREHEQMYHWTSHNDPERLR